MELFYIIILSSPLTDTTPSAQSKKGKENNFTNDNKW